MQPWPKIESLEPKKMHNVRMPVQLLASLRALADAMPGWSVSDLVVIGSTLVAQLGAIPIGRETMQELTAARLAHNAMTLHSSPQGKQLVAMLKAWKAERKRIARGADAKAHAKKGAK